MSGTTMNKMTLATMLAIVAGTVATAAAAAAQEARLTNADVRTTAASSNLAAQIRTIVEQQAEPAWIGYAQESVDVRMNACCYDGGVSFSRDGAANAACAACLLERDESGVRKTSAASSESGATAPAGTGTGAAAKAAKTIALEGSGRFVVLARVDQRQIERVRVFSTDCELDAGGRRVYLITGVAPAASVAWLESLVSTDAAPPADAAIGASRRGRSSGARLDAAIMAIAFHRDAAADAALDRLVSPAMPTGVRRKATFWLASARGAHGLAVAERLVRDDADAGVRKHAVFALTVSKEPGATPALLVAARHSPFTDVRAEAIFWTAQVAGRRAAATITEAIEQDPETAVKKKAVFALSQLPKDEGVPLLIDVARKNQNPAVRKQAMFWLGQSKDPRALHFFESILK